MKFVVLGAGAMGSLFGGYLAQAGADVTLVDINEVHIEAVRRNGLLIDRGEGAERISLKATTDPSTVAPADVVIVLCKYLSTDVALESAKPYLTSETYVWTLQNGIGNVDIIKRHVPEARIVKGLTSATGILTGPGSVETNFKGETETYYWPLDGGEHPVLKGAEELLASAGLPTCKAGDIDYRIWRKLVINATLTVLAGMMNTRIGAVYFNEPGRKLCEDIVAEVVAVARASGVALELNDALCYLDKLAHAAVDHIGSTTISLQRKERTEVDAMSGAVVREGRRHGIATPVNQTITRLVKLIEETSGERLSPPI